MSKDLEKIVSDLKNLVAISEAALSDGVLHHRSNILSTDERKNIYRNDLRSIRSLAENLEKQI